MELNIMVIGSGGREHALVWKLAQSPLAEKIYAVPGNPGIAELATCVENINVKDHAAVIDFAQRNEIGLVVIGPEGTGRRAFAGTPVRRLPPLNSRARKYLPSS